MGGSDVDMDQEGQAGEEGMTQEETKEWEKKLRLIHGATGHGSVESLVRTLRQRGVRPEVLQLAKRFVCDTCEERKRPAPRRVANLELVPKRWTVALAESRLGFSWTRVTGFWWVAFWWKEKRTV